MDLLVPKFIRFQLYLLQLENYELGRYWKLLFKKGFWPRGEQRKELVWSAKVKALMLMAAALHALIVIIAGLTTLISTGVIGYLFIAGIAALFIFLPFYFIFFTIALLVLLPLDSLAKQRLVAQAKSKISNLKSEIKIIGVAGSYGKTTMKEVLGAVLSAKFRVLTTPESVNTPVGIARWILNKVNDETQIVIVEMGEHYQGDIEEICRIAKPDIAVVTGINESHLERMKNLDTVVATVFEIISNSKPGAVVLLNANDARVMENYKKFVWPDHKVEQFSIFNFQFSKFNPEKLSWSCVAQDIGELEIGLLGEYALGDVDAAIKIGKSLGMDNGQIIAGINKIKPVEHRLQPITSPGDILVIDDAYNGNPDGVAEATKVLSRFKNRRKLFITPGLVEMGKSATEVHREIGKQLVGIADVVILIKNSVAPFIEEGIFSWRHSEGARATEESQKEILRSAQDDADKKPKIIWFNSAPEAHAALKNILKPGDVILFQNDWGDQYL